MMRLAQKNKKHLILACLYSISMSALAVDGIKKKSGAEHIQQCMQKAASMYSLHPHLLWAIAKQESGFNQNAINRNTNGSYDIGIMQINSQWLPSLKRYGITESELGNPCVNIHVGAWVLANNIKTMGLTWRAVGAYNAASENKRLIYAGKIKRNVDEAQKWQLRQNIAQKPNTGSKSEAMADSEKYSKPEDGVFRTKNVALNIIRTGTEN